MNQAAEEIVSKFGPDPLQVLTELAMQDYKLASESFIHFFRAAWSVLEPSAPLLNNWHQECIAEYLQATLTGDIKRLIINVPPRYSKSLMVTVMFPAWCWIKDPSLRFINASYSEDLATKHNVDRRTLMRSEWYRTAWGHKFQFSEEQNQKTEYVNDKRGHMVAAGMLGTVTGKGGDYVIIDDPHNPKKAESDAERTAAVNAFDSTFTTRLDNKKTGRMIVVMQRLHFKDLTGHLLDKKAQGEDWTHLKLPAEAPKRTIVVFPISKRKIIREKNDVLHPDREGPKELKAMKIALGSYGYAGQYDQNPTPRVGGLFKKTYWRYYTALPQKFDQIILSWDMSFKDLTSSDEVCGFAMGIVGADIYIFDCENDQWGFSKTCEALKRMSLRHPLAIRKLVEDKANGPAVIDYLKSKIAGLIAENPEGSKMERAALVEPIVESGNVHLPHPSIAPPWVQKLIDQAAAFPKGDRDDMVDAMTQGIKYLMPMALDRLRALGTM